MVPCPSIGQLVGSVIRAAGFAMHDSLSAVSTMVDLSRFVLATGSSSARPFNASVQRLRIPSLQLLASLVGPAIMQGIDHECR